MILVTGADTALGTNIACELLAGGYSVRGLVGRRQDYRGPTGRKIELVEGDYTDGECLRRVLPRCEAVIHAAAMTSRSGRNYGDYHRANVVGTRNLIDAAADHGAKRVVVVSSANVFGYGSREIPGCELHDMSEPFASSYYYRSMYEALRAAMKAAGPVEVVAVAPSDIVGPYCTGRDGDMALPKVYGKKLVFAPPGGANFVHAGDAALGVVRALERGKSGETYILCSENLTWKEFYKKIGEVAGKKTLCVGIPSLSMYAAGGAGSFLRMLGFCTRLSLTNMRILCTDGYYHNYKASRDLGVEFRPVEDAVRDALKWFAAAGISAECLK